MTPTGSAVLAALLAGLAVLLVVPGRAVSPRRRPAGPAPAARAPAARAPAARAPAARAPVALAAVLVAAVATALVLGGAVGAAAGLGVGAWGVHRVRHAEGGAERAARARAAAELPHLVLLLAATLRGGASPSAGLAAAAEALPGPAADRVAGACRRLVLGVDPAEVWSSLADDVALAPLGRALARAHASGAPVVGAVERLADDLATDTRARVEERARTVGVRAAVPLGLCLLPAFLLLGVVPLAAGLLGQVTP